MMLRGPFLPEAVGNVAGLDELAAGRSSVAALAAYDAAFILEMVPPPDSNSDYWAELAERFEEAATRLEDPDPRALAIDHARAAAETARALREQPTADPNARGQGEDEAE